MKRFTYCFLCMIVSMHVFSQSEVSKELFPTLAGLQRTICSEYCDEDNRTYLVEAPSKTKYINEKLYVRYGGFYLREEGKRIFVYSYIQQKDLLLYDFTLQVGDSLPRLYTDWSIENEEYGNVVDYPTMTGYVNPILVVDLSEVTLLNGKKYKKWTFNNGMEYVENIGAYGRYKYAGDFFQLIADIPLPCYMSSRLICVSIDGMLLYQLDEAEMDSLGVECLCDVEKNWSDTWCNQWNILSHGVGCMPNEPFPHARTSIYWLSENTINRNGYEYIPLMCSSSKPNVEQTSLVGELRFTENKQVYFYYDNTEHLLYDFGAQVGDRLQVFPGINNYNRYDNKSYTHVVTRREYLEDGKIKLTSIPFFDTEIPNVINENDFRSVSWIEGVGSVHGIVHNNINNTPGIGGDWLLCAYRDDECRYTTDNPEYMPLGCIYNEGDVINAVENVSPSIPSAHKIIKDGQVLILRNGKTYTLQGQEVK